MISVIDKKTDERVTNYRNQKPRSDKDKSQKTLINPLLSNEPTVSRWNKWFNPLVFVILLRNLINRANPMFNEKDNFHKKSTGPWFIVTSANNKIVKRLYEPAKGTVKLFCQKLNNLIKK